MHPYLWHYGLICIIPCNSFYSSFKIKLWDLGSADNYPKPQNWEVTGGRKPPHRATRRSLQWYPALDVLSEWIGNDRWGDPLLEPDWELALNKN